MFMNQVYEYYILELWLEIWNVISESNTLILCCNVITWI